MKRIFFFLTLTFAFGLVAQAQLPGMGGAQQKPIRWKTKVSEQNPKVGQTVELVFSADIDKDWYLYSTDFDKDLGPMVTEFAFAPNGSYKLAVDTIVPVSPKRKYDDEIWMGEYSYFTKQAEFRQQVVVLKEDFKADVTIRYQVCTEVDGRCIPYTDEFSFSFKAAAGSAEGEGENKGSAEGLLALVVSAIGGGLLALLTPCVFPIIPLTVSYFTSKGKAGAGQALFFGASIVGIFALLGLPFALFSVHPSLANLFSTHWLPNMIFFSIFFFFSLSFFGLFELTLPSGFVNDMNTKADKGGWLGVFFMAVTLAVVSFSCTAPVVGSILLLAALDGELFRPALAGGVFGLTMAVPFVVFALFPQLMKGLPKSGGWLNSVKVTLGFIELAFAFKFVSVADQVYHWGILDREINIAIWVAIASFMGLYYLGKIRLPHDTPSEKTSVGGLLLALAAFSFVVYLVPGMFGAPLKAMAGYLPPQSSHNFDLVAQNRQVLRQELGNVAFASNAGEGETQRPSRARFEDRFHLPHGLRGYFDYEEALAAAKRQNKPLFIDFTGHGCVNCRKMEDQVWSDDAVLRRLREEYVVVALYVDDRLQLPEDEWVVSEIDGRTKKTLGEVNHELQITKFGQVAQPYYVLLGHDEQVLVDPVAYEPNVERFVKFLDAGIAAYRQKNGELASK